MVKRDERRYHKRRMKNRARRFYPWAGKRAEKWADHLCLCSAPCCGNPRKWLKNNLAETQQEKRSDLETKEFFDNLE